MRHTWHRLGAIVAASVLLLPAAAWADRLQSTHFRLDPNVTASFGGSASSGSYKLTDTGGEAAVSSAASQSYKLTQGYQSQLSHSLQLAVLASGTAASWPLDTGSGSLGYDVASTSNDATLIGSPTWATGIIGQSITLNGTSQYLSTKNQLTGPNPVTVEVWFKSTSSSGGRLIGFGDAQTGASTNRDRQLYLTNAGQLVFGVNPGTIKTITTSATYNDGSWHHVVGTLGAAGLALYVDGVQRASDATTTTAGSYSGYWRLGYDNLTGWPNAPTSSFLAGTLDEARVYTRQLSAAEIANSYSAGANAIRGAFTLPNVTPGQSQVYAADAIIRTDAPGYDLYIQSLGPLTHTDHATTIPDITATIASPALWSEGVTKGLGFGVTSGTQLEAKWGSSPNYAYAKVPAATTVYHSRTGETGGTPEITSLQFRADTAANQKQGTYSTTLIYTATIRP